MSDLFGLAAGVLGPVFSGLFGSEESEASQLASQAYGTGASIYAEQMGNLERLRNQAYEVLPAYYSEARRYLQQGIDTAAQHFGQAIATTNSSLDSAIQTLMQTGASARDILSGQHNVALADLVKYFDEAKSQYAKQQQAGDIARSNVLGLLGGTVDVGDTGLYKTMAKNVLSDTQSAQAAVGNLLSGGAASELSENLYNNAYSSAFDKLMSGYQYLTGQGDLANSALASLAARQASETSNLDYTYGQNMANSWQAQGTGIAGMQQSRANTLANLGAQAAGSIQSGLTKIASTFSDQYKRWLEAGLMSQSLIEKYLGTLPQYVTAAASANQTSASGNVWGNAFGALGNNLIAWNNSRNNGSLFG